jgi:hypothetical protein
MAVHQHDAVSAFERGLGRADIHAGRMFAMLAHHRQRQSASAADILDLDLAYPLRVGRAGLAGQAVLFVAGAHAIVAAFLALGGIDQHAPAHSRTGRLGITLRSLIQHHPRRYGDGRGTRRSLQELPALGIDIAHFVSFLASASLRLLA